MKKLLLISGSLPPIKCGVGFYAARLSRELARQKVDFSILSTGGVGKDLPATLLTVPAWKIYNLPEILRQIRQSSADIIHIQYPAVGYRRQLGINLLPYMIRLLRPHLKLVITLHEYHASRWIGRMRDLITIFPAHKIIISNNADKISLPRWVNQKAVIIPIGNNIETSPPSPEVYKTALAEQGLDTDKPTLLFFGFAYPAKRAEVLLEALDKPELQGYQALLLTNFREDSKYHRMLTDKINNLNQQHKRVGVLSGFIEDKRLSGILSGGRYFVFPQAGPISAKSGTSIAGVDNGLILVAAGSSNPAETLPFKTGENCLLITPLSSDALAKGISELDRDNKARNKIKQGSLRLAEYFAWPNIIKKHLKLYGDL